MAVKFDMVENLNKNTPYNSTSQFWSTNNTPFVTGQYFTGRLSRPS